MRHALVVYETLFGNSKAAAVSVAEGMGDAFDVRVVDVRDAPEVIDADVDLVVVGGPTHTLGMTRPGSRRQASAQYTETPPAADVGLREWLSKVKAPKDTSAAAFDTRLSHPRIVRALGHASNTERRMLRKCGMRMIAPAEEFLVESPTGPMADGELARAREWGRQLATLAAADSS